MDSLDSLLGQARPAALLRRAVKHERVSHAYLFHGPEQVGKAAAARRFAEILLCQDPAANRKAEACGGCRSCRLLAAGTHPDFRYLTFEVDERGRLRAEIVLHQIRPPPNEPRPHPLPLLPDAQLRSVEGRYKVYVIDPADRLNPEAGNALLKCLEEPPPHVVIILVSARPAAVLPTLVSRCQPVAFHLADTAAIAAELESRGLPPERARFLAALSGGRPGWAFQASAQPELLETRDRLCALLGDLPAPRGALRLAGDIGALGLQLWEATRAPEAPTDDAAEPKGERLTPERKLREKVPELLEMMLIWYRDLLVVETAPELVSNLDHRETLARQRKRLTASDITAALDRLEAARWAIGRNASVSLALECLAVGLLSA